MKTFTYILALMLALPATIPAQGLQHYLNSVEANCPALESSASLCEAARAEARAGNVPEDPSIEFSPFFADGTDGMATSEMVVSMGFDFPTLYASRAKYGKISGNAAELQYMIARRDILLSAAGMWMDRVMLEQNRQLLQDRLQYADSMTAVCRTRLERGDASAIDLNKARLDAMTARVELNGTEASLRQIKAKMAALNNGEEVKFTADGYPALFNIAPDDSLAEKMLGFELEVQAAETQVALTQQSLSVERQGWIPKFEAGYRRNTDEDKVLNGFIIGASFPVFSNINKSKAAKARLQASEHQNEAARLEAKARIESGLDELSRLEQSIKCYDRELMDETLTMLRKAVNEGYMGIGDYYIEADKIYQYLQSLNQLENTYHKTVLEVFKNYL